MRHKRTWRYSNRIILCTCFLFLEERGTCSPIYSLDLLLDGPTDVIFNFAFSMDNYAEKLFKTMEDKNSRSYDAMVLALLKVQ